MITNEGYKRLFRFIIWCIVATLVAIIGISNVFADTYIDFTDVHSNTTLYVGYADSGNPISWPYNNSSLYQSNIISLDYVVNKQIVANTHYEFESHMIANRLIGTSVYSVVDASGNACLTDSYYLNFLNGEYPRWDFQCSSNSSGFTIHIQQSNSSRLFNDGYMGWGSAILSKTSKPISSSGNDTQEVIDNANANTNQIIDNQNQNTQTIINNNFYTNYECSDKDSYSLTNSTKGKYLSSTGALTSNSNFSVSPYIVIQPNNSYVFTYSSNSINNPSICWYDNERTLISCSSWGNTSPLTLTSPTSAYYVRVSKRTNYNATISGNICINRTDALNDTLKDDNIDDNNISSAFEDFNDYLDDNSTITQLLTLPITLFTAILNNVNGTCQPFNLGALYGENLILPCINVSQYLGNTLWTMIDIIISGFSIFAISKKMIKVFNNFSSLKEGDVIDD